MAVVTPGLRRSGSDEFPEAITASGQREMRRRAQRVDLLDLSDEVERTIDAAQSDHLNGDPRGAQAKLRAAIRMLDTLAVDCA